jgi:hypothetical protein
LTSRERLLAASRGGETDVQATLAWPKGDSDALIVSTISDIRSSPVTDKTILYKLDNPFGKALAAGEDLNRKLEDSPEEGAQIVQELALSVTKEGRDALESGADGILYVLQGARGAYCTPMQYGGWYLETDRKILESFGEANLNVLLVVGNDDLYIDFVSDLPAHVFAWDADASTFDATYVRTLREGALASNDPNSEIKLSTGVTSVADYLMKEPAYA